MTRSEARALAFSTIAAGAACSCALFLHLPEALPATVDIMNSVRWPEALTAAVVGGGLGLSGLLFQLVLRNDLADPYVLGVAGGSSFGAVLVLLALGGSAALWGLPLMGLAAFAGGLLTLAALTAVSAGRVGRLLLAGVIANTAFAAAARVVTVWLSPSQLAHVTAFLIGFIPTPPVWVPMAAALPVLALMALFSAKGRGLDLLLLSEDEATALGLDVRRVRRGALVWATLLASMGVALCGMIGFVGLLAPHAARLLAGRRHRVLVPVSFLLGAAFLLAAHALGKVLAEVVFLPVGVYTSLVGAPAFLALLITKDRRMAP